MDREQEKDKARKRFEQKRRTKERFARILKEQHDFNERSWYYAYYGEKIWEWFKSRMRFCESRKNCACSMCRNPRRDKWDSKNVTLQELKFLDMMKDQLEDYENPED